MPKYRKFFNDIATLRGDLRGVNTVLAKEVIGDSSNNHRTLTVNQTVRFLTAIGKKKLARQLEATRNVIEPYVIRNRTDALDINEFVSTYREVVMNGGFLRGEIGRSLKGV